MNDTIEKSYLSHVDAERDYRIRGIIPSCYSNPESIDAWRHHRMRNTIEPVTDFFQHSKWITIGDGSFASDAHFLENKNLDVLATSISDETISYAHSKGYIQKYKVVNAENIQENDNSFDFAFCKESFHHFPRPYQGLYEMLRISNKGVILIEPQEGKNKLFDSLKNAIKFILRKDKNSDFESTGNFIYRVNIGELKKVMTALNHKTIAYKRFNDFFHSSLSAKSSKSLNIAKIITLFGIGIQNIFCKIGFMNYGLVTVILFKNDVSEELLSNLKEKGFQIKRLPQNPYLSQTK